MKIPDKGGFTPKKSKPNPLLDNPKSAGQASQTDKKTKDEGDKAKSG